MGPELSRRADELVAGRIPFVAATVVRAQRPTSVHAGDSAIILGDGSIEGFVGGACAETSVRLQALRVLETGEPLLLRIVPEGDEDGVAAEGAIVVRNDCLSGGALEIFLEPRLPAPRIAVVGETPIGLALRSVGERIGYDVVVGSSGPETVDELALVVASHGREEEGALRAALESGVPYVGLVASRRRADAVRQALLAEGVPADRVAALHSPAGLDIGARTPEEIALSILAEIISVRQADPLARVTSHQSPVTSSVDPVCGMTVATTADAPQLEHDGRLLFFCCDGCRAAFEREPARYAVEPA
jgi:xanthine dehydrogenase accessory factor